MDDSALRNPHSFFVELQLGYRRAKTVFVALELGLFERLEGTTDSAEGMAAALGCHGRPLSLLLRALVSLGLLEHRNGGYGNTPFASAHLVPGGTHYVGHNLRFQNMVWPGWSELETVLKTGAPWRELPDLLSEAGEGFAEQYIRGMVPVSAGPAHLVAARLSGRPPTTVLDLGCGPGRYAIALLERHPGLRATLFDLPEPLAVTEQLVRDHPARDRLELVAGNYITDEYGRDFDLVVMSHITHDEAPEVVASMCRKAFASLAPGGRIAIHDWIADADSADPEFAAFFSLHVAIYSHGQVYSRAEYTGFLRDAGFHGVRSEELGAPGVRNPTSLVTAVKPG